MPHWICEDCGGHFKMHQQEHVCQGLCPQEKKTKLKTHVVCLKSEMLKTLEQAGNDEILDEYQTWVLEKMIEELESWVSI